MQEGGITAGDELSYLRQQNGELQALDGTNAEILSMRYPNPDQRPCKSALFRRNWSGKPRSCCS